MRDFLLYLVFAAIVAVGFGGGVYYGRHVGVSADTVTVYRLIKVPQLQVVQLPATTTPPKEVVQWKTDTTAQESLRCYVKTLLVERDSLQGRLLQKLAPHYATYNFTQAYDSAQGELAGRFFMRYEPVAERFSVQLTWDKFVMPVQTITVRERPAWWVKPALAAGGALTYYFIREEQTSNALLAGGAVTLLLTVEF